MIRNYVTTALRALARDGSFAAINISGLAVGMAVCLLMLLFVRQHWLKDQFHSNPDRVQRVTTVLPDGKHYAAAPAPVGTALQQRSTGVASVARIWQSSGALIERGPNRFEEVYMYADPSFFDVLDGFELAEGSESTALSAPDQAVLSSEMARKLYGTVNATGRTFTLRGAALSDPREITVTGVLEKRPRDEPSHLSTNIILSSATVPAGHRWVFADDWETVSRNYTYVRLREAAQPEDLQTLLNELSETHYAGDETRYQFNRQSLSDIALSPSGGPTWNSIYGSNTLNRFLAYVLVGLGLVVLIAAAFNYVNLTVARSLRRAKEVGVRKALRAGRHHVAGQFLVESILLALGATVAAALLLNALVPAFKSLYSIRFLDPGLTFNPIAEPVLIVLLLAFGLLVGGVAGAYPAWALSRPEPTDVLSDSPSSRSIWKGFWRVRLRKSLVGIQIVFAIIVTVSTALLYQQSQTIRNADHGFETEQLFTVALEDVDYASFKQQAQQVVGVEDVTGMKDIFMGGNHDFRALTRPGQTDSVEVEYFATDSTFTRVADLNLSDRLPDLGQAYASGTAVVLNQASASALGFQQPRAALGQDVRIDSAGPYRVVGIADDVWFDGRDAARIEPFVLRYRSGPASLCARARRLGARHAAGDGIAGTGLGVSRLGISVRAALLRRHEAQFVRAVSGSRVSDRIGRLPRAHHRLSRTRGARRLHRADTPPRDRDSQSSRRERVDGRAPTDLGACVGARRRCRGRGSTRVDRGRPDLATSVSPDAHPECAHGCREHRRPRRRRAGGGRRAGVARGDHFSRSGPAGRVGSGSVPTQAL